MNAALPHPDGFRFLLDPLRRRIDRIEPSRPFVARLLVHMIPARCPFERDVVLFGRKLLHIPALCHLNPLYDQLTALRFRALCFLETTAAVPDADSCGGGAGAPQI